MNSFIQLFTAESVAHSVLILSLVAAFGLALGSIKIWGINLGIAGVLFAGLIFGHFHWTIDPHVMEFIREFGLILFVYTIGMQVGPGFIASFKRDGLRLNALAALIVILGVAVTFIISREAKIPMITAVGLFSGATTNTPSLAASQQALKDIPAVTEAMLKMPGIGYAVAYPFGIVGIILTMLLLRMIFRVSPHQEAIAHAKGYKAQAAGLATLNLEVKNHNLNGLPLQKIPALSGAGIVVSRVLHNNKLTLAQPETVIYQGDVILAVGPRPKLDELKLIVGEESPLDLRSMQSNIVSRRILVTNKSILGKTFREINLFSRFNITVTRVSRMELEFSASPDLRLQFADTLLCVGEEGEIKKAAGALGDSPRQLDHPQVIPVFVGIAIGVIVGSIPIFLPGMSAPVKLGMAGGPLITAILLSRVRHWGPLVWYMPISANFMLREVGIVLFLACVGLKSGDQFVATLAHGDGFLWMAWAALITFLPLAAVGIFARLYWKMNFMSLCGLLAGSMTDPPALAYATTLTNSNAPAVSYATVYPLVMIMRVVAAQILVLFFVH